jgi:hypothetical protein
LSRKINHKIEERHLLFVSFCFPPGPNLLGVLFLRRVGEKNNPIEFHLAGLGEGRSSRRHLFIVIEFVFSRPREGKTFKSRFLKKEPFLKV